VGEEEHDVKQEDVKHELPSSSKKQKAAIKKEK